MLAGILVFLPLASALAFGVRGVEYTYLQFTVLTIFNCTMQQLSIYSHYWGTVTTGPPQNFSLLCTH